MDNRSATPEIVRTLFAITEPGTGAAAWRSQQIDGDRRLHCFKLAFDDNKCLGTREGRHARGCANANMVVFSGLSLGVARVVQLLDTFDRIVLPRRAAPAACLLYLCIYGHPQSDPGPASRPRAAPAGRVARLFVLFVHLGAAARGPGRLLRGSACDRRISRAGSEPLPLQA